jgi:FkbM family methyltransferase
MLPKIELVETKIGSLLLFQNEDFISQALRKNGSWAELESSIAILMAKNTGPSFILDIGANLGTFCIPVAKKLASQNIHVHAFEPQRIIFQQLNGNLFLNQIENCFTHNFALGSSIGIMNLPKIDYLQTKNIGAVSLLSEIQRKTNVSYHASETEKVEIKTLDSLDLDGQCSFIKIDVEGFESEVISGSLNFLKKQSFPPILFEEWRKGKFSGDACDIVEERQAKTRALLGDLGYLFLNLGLEALAQHPQAKTEVVMEKSNNGQRELKRIR